MDELLGSAAIRLALVNAGVALSTEFIRQAFTSAATLGVMLGFVVGIGVGVTGFA